MLKIALFCGFVGRPIKDFANIPVDERGMFCYNIL